jgi:asparagine synthase (glutamine-hydrolysing)
VILSGEGADESFAGHRWYEDDPNPRATARRRWLRRLRGATPDPFASHLARVGSLGFLPAPELLCEAPSVSPLHLFRRFDDPSAPRVTRLQLADLRTFLVDDVLLGIDHASMACGVEVRVPFLDHELVEIAFSIESWWSARRASARRCSRGPRRAGCRRRS